MSTLKLTLSIPEKVLAGAKSYSKRTHQPLSRLVSRYFAILCRGGTDDADPVTSRVKQATGLVKSDKGKEDLLFEALASKYK